MTKYQSQMIVFVVTTVLALAAYDVIDLLRNRHAV